MRVGMLWFDDDSERDLAAKIDRAVRHYKAKYGACPTICYMNPSMLPRHPVSGIELEIRASNSVLPNHFWLGIGENSSMEKLSAA